METPDTPSLWTVSQRRGSDESASRAPVPFCFLSLCSWVCFLLEQQPYGDPGGGMAFPVKVDGGVRVRGWTITTKQDHILESRCGCSHLHGTSEDGVAAASEAVYTLPPPGPVAAAGCNFCRFSKELELPSLPEEVYASSFLRLQHTASGETIEVSVAYSSAAPCEPSRSARASCSQHRVGLDCAHPVLWSSQQLRHLHPQAQWATRFTSSVYSRSQLCAILAGHEQIWPLSSWPCLGHELH